MSNKKEDKKGYMVFHNGYFYGVLEDKKEYNDFLKQRPQDSYDIIKLKWGKILEATKNEDIGRYSTVRATNGFILFTHEEVGLIEFAEGCVIDARDDIENFYKYFDYYLKFTNEESRIMKLFLIVFVRLFGELVENSIFFTSDNNADSQPNIDNIIERWLEVIAVVEDTDLGPWW